MIKKSLIILCIFFFNIIYIANADYVNDINNQNKIISNSLNTLEKFKNGDTTVTQDEVNKAFSDLSDNGIDTGEGFFSNRDLDETINNTKDKISNNNQNKKEYEYINSDEAANERMDKLNQTIKTEEEALSNIETEKNNIDKDLSNNKGLKNVAELDKNIADEEFDKYVEARNDIRDAKEEQESNLSDLESKLDDAISSGDVNKANDLKEEIEDTKGNIDESKKMLDNYEKQVEEAKKNKIDSTKKLNDLNNKIDELKNKKNKIDSDYESCIEDRETCTKNYLEAKKKNEDEKKANEQQKADLEKTKEEKESNAKKEAEKAEQKIKEDEEKANPGLKTLGSPETMYALLGITGKSSIINGDNNTEEGGFTTLTRLFVWFKDSLTGLVQLLAVGAFLFVGIRLGMARGNPEEFKKALQHMIYVIVGIFVISISWAAVVLVAGISI